MEVIVVCGHGIRGGRLDEVVRYVWPPRIPHVAHWATPVPGPSGEVQQTQLAGDRAAVTSIFTAGAAAPRMHHEILCTAPHCLARAYRSDVARLQTLLRAIVDIDAVREVFAVSATDTTVTVTLEALHLARDIVRRHYGLLT